MVGGIRSRSSKVCASRLYRVFFCKLCLYVPSKRGPDRQFLQQTLSRYAPSLRRHVFTLAPDATPLAERRVSMATERKRCTCFYSDAQETKVNNRHALKYTRYWLRRSFPCLVYFERRPWAASVNKACCCAADAASTQQHGSAD